MAWGSLNCAIWLLTCLEPESMRARLETGFSFREFYWAVHARKLYTSAKCRRFPRCLGCNIAKGGSCGGPRSSWLCRSRISDAEMDETPECGESAVVYMTATMVPHALLSHAALHYKLISKQSLQSPSVPCAYRTSQPVLKSELVGSEAVIFSHCTQSISGMGVHAMAGQPASCHEAALQQWYPVL